ncbi:MAG: restriction endonuclease subunit S [Alistipes sp.]|nr:restriction endonuclease subunit S [Alistipes sp.]
MNMTIPQGYKQTELGIIPEDWQLQSVGKHCSVKARIGWQGLRSDEYLTSGEYGLITSTDIVDGMVDWGTCCFVSKARYSQDPNIIVQENDTLISKDGTIGKVGIVQNIPFPSTLNSGIFVVRPKLDNVYKKYLAFAFKSIYFQDFINRLTAGSTIVHLYQKDIVNFVFPVPPIAEQRAIAEALSDVDGLIAALDKKIAKKRLLKQGAMQQLLTGKKRLPGFTDEWVDCELKDYFEITAGGDVDIDKFSSVKTSYCKYPIYSNSLDKEGLYGYTSRPNYSAGSVTITGRGTLGHAEYRDYAFDAIVRLIVMTPKGNRVCGLFIKELLNLTEPFIFESTGVPQLTSPQVGSTKIKVPQKIEEQQAIATILSDMDKEIADLEAQRDKYRLLKSGMMQKLLTGQIRLKTK